MRSLILRSFSITAIALLFIQDAGAQRGRGYYRHYGYGPYRGQRVVHIGGPRVVIPYGGISFHYSNGYYYRPYSNYFRVVAPPIGIHINILPRGYRRVYVVVINDQKYFELDGTYYKEEIRDNDEIWYTVVGKNGKLSTDEEYEDDTPYIGDTVNELPPNCKTVVVNGNRYYVSPDDVYYEEIGSGDNIRYKVVGK